MRSLANRQGNGGGATMALRDACVYRAWASLEIERPGFVLVQREADRIPLDGFEKSGSVHAPAST